MPFTTVLLDLDGVLRHFDPAHRPAVEQRHGLEPNTLRPAAFATDLIVQAVTGKISRAQWIEIIGERVGSPEAAAEWLAHRGVADPEMLAECDRLRGAGYVVAVLTNGTDIIANEMIELGIGEHVDAVFNTWDIGYAKPDRRAFEHCVRELGVDPADVFFTDDTKSKLTGAIELGMTARHFRGIEPFRADLRELKIG